MLSLFSPRTATAGRAGRSRPPASSGTRAHAAGKQGRKLLTEYKSRLRQQCCSGLERGPLGGCGSGVVRPARLHDVDVDCEPGDQLARRAIVEEGNLLRHDPVEQSLPKPRGKTLTRHPRCGHLRDRSVKSRNPAQMRKRSGRSIKEIQQVAKRDHEGIAVQVRPFPLPSSSLFFSPAPRPRAQERRARRPELPRPSAGRRAGRRG